MQHRRLGLLDPVFVAAGASMRPLLFVFFLSGAPQVELFSCLDPVSRSRAADTLDIASRFPDSPTVDRVETSGNTEFHFPGFDRKRKKEKKKKSKDHAVGKQANMLG